MKTKEEIVEALDRVDDVRSGIGTKFHGMSYEDGVAEALGWILGDLSNEEFEYAE